MQRLTPTIAILALGLAVAAAAMNAPAFLGFAVHADTLYPALLVADLRADPAALVRFRPSRVPSFIPDVALAALIDAVTGSWRLAFWGYGALAFALLALLGGWIARAVFGPLARGAGVWLALILAALVVLGLLQQAHVAAAAPGADLPANLHLMLLMPIWQSGAFIAGLGVLCLTWRATLHRSPARLLALGLVALLATASNTIVVAHAVLPGMIALAEAARRGALPWRGAAAIGAMLALAVGAGFALGAATGRAPLPTGPGGGLTAALSAALAALPRDLLREPQQLLMLLACVPIALAFLLPRRAAAGLPRGADPEALRFFVVAASAACAAGVLITAGLYHGPHAWRYANPTAWWPAIFLAGLLAVRWRRGATAVALLAAGGIAAISAIAGGAATPAILRWRPPELACLDAADPEVRLRAGLAAYWYARTMAAASDWRRQVESVDFGEGRPFLWIEDSRSVVQARHAPRGTPPPYRFILMTGLDPAAITRIHGAPERVVPCGDTAIWIYPEGWDPVDRLVAMADPLIPHALAVGRTVCTGTAGLLEEDGRVVTLPPGRWRIGLRHGAGAARWRILDDSDGASLQEVVAGPDAGTAVAEAGRWGAPLRLRLLVRSGAAPGMALHALSIGPAGGAAAACRVQPGG